MQKLDETFISIDRFGVPVTVNYRGFKTYKTRCGACCSIGYYLIMVMATLFLFEKMYTFEATSITMFEMPLDDGFVQSSNLHLDDFGVSIILETYIPERGTTYDIPERYGRIVVYKPLEYQTADAKI